MGTFKEPDAMRMKMRALVNKSAAPSKKFSLTVSTRDSTDMQNSKIHVKGVLDFGK